MNVLIIRKAFSPFILLIFCSFPFLYNNLFSYFLLTKSLFPFISPLLAPWIHLTHSLFPHLPQILFNCIIHRFLFIQKPVTSQHMVTGDVLVCFEFKSISVSCMIWSYCFCNRCPSPLSIALGTELTGVVYMLRGPSHETWRDAQTNKHTNNTGMQAWEQKSTAFHNKVTVSQSLLSKIPKKEKGQMTFSNVCW